ncbi:putative ankyrin-3 [Rosellinia necatrix]|uniref:Putative ankyrin-3 n=1 Tax=Rosellinia necatrix TaxID=77044 RepID=A0A1S8A7Z1_ROSNE|nr:putative ankyrin-3 [Rosellinia necatrix]
MDESLIVTLNEELIEDGEFRTRNEKGQKFRPNLVDRGNSLSTKVDIVGMTHGTFSKTNHFATLLVFELRFLATGGRNFKQATVMFQFEDAAGITSRDPVVHAIAPRDRLALNRTERVRNIRWGVNIGGNIGSDAAGVEAGALW